MAGHEARINDALRQLGEEFRLGMVKADEYRERRKRLLESWGERDQTTSPGGKRTLPNTAAGGRAPAAAPAPAKRSPMPMIVAASAGLLLLAGGGWYLMGPGAKQKVAPPGGTVAPMSPGAAAVLKAADEFLSRNAWEAEAIEAFLAQWRTLSPTDRARVIDEPSLRTLRYKLDQNIQAESQLVAPDAPPEQRERLALLENFAKELRGDAQ